MTTTPKYEFDKTDLGLTGWNALLQGLAEDMDDFLHTRILVTLGESVAAFKPVYCGADGKYYLSQGVAGKVPCRGITIEAGNADDEIRIVRMGPLSIPSGGFTAGKQIYVGTGGGLIEVRPREFAQRVGQVISATVIFVWIQELSQINFGPTPAPDPPTNYLDGTVYFQYSGTTTTTEAVVTTTTTEAVVTTTTTV